MIYVNPKAFFVDRNGKRVYVKVVSPTAADGAYYKIGAPSNDNAAG
jgi:hypothetical protein